VFGNTVLSDEVAEGWKKLCNELFPNLYGLLNIIQLIKSAEMSGTRSMHGQDGEYV
jgi:hypothetical protein